MSDYNDINIPKDSEEIEETSSPMDHGKCVKTVHQDICVQTQVTITPKVEAGPAQVRCVGGACIRPCSCRQTTRCCTFTVSQNICVQVPLVFSATAEANQTGVMCGPAASGPCCD